MSTFRITAEAVYGITRATDRIFGGHSWKLDGREPRRILALCLSHLGDLVLLTPLFANLKLRFPNAHLAVVCKSVVADIPRHHSAVDEVITYEARWILGPASRRAGFLDTLKLLRNLRGRKDDLLVIAYDHPLDRILGLYSGIGTQVSLPIVDVSPVPSGDGSSHPRHRIEHAYDLLRALDVPVVEKEPSIGLPAADQVWAEEWLREQGLIGNPILGVHAGAGGPQKRWPSDRFARVADKLVETFHCKVVATGSPVDAEAVQGFMANAGSPVVRAPDTLTVGKLCALIRHFTLLLCNDCGPMHIAAASHVPVVAIFGSSFPELSGLFPADPRHVVIAAADGRMESVTVEQIFGAIAARPQLLNHLSSKSGLVLQSLE